MINCQSHERIKSIADEEISRTRIILSTDEALIGKELSHA